MRKKTEPSQEDLDAFMSAVKDVKPLVTRHKKALKPTTPQHSPLPPHSPCTEPTLSLTDLDYLEEVCAEEIITHKHISVSHKILRKLRKGQYNVDAKLDLHGKNVVAAKMTVERFLQRCLTMGSRVVLIIHGKGRHDRAPILKNKLNQWLRDTHCVLAFCSAIPAHGGGGATYVLLKRLGPMDDYHAGCTTNSID